MTGDMHGWTKYDNMSGDIAGVPSLPIVLVHCEGCDLYLEIGDVTEENMHNMAPC